MIRTKLLLILGLMLVWGVSPSANAGTLVLDSFVDQSPVTVDTAPTATKILMATVNTSGAQGGNDATATTVTIGGSVVNDAIGPPVVFDVAEVCVDYGAIEIACVTNPSSLTNIVINLGGNQKGGSAFDYRVTLNSSAGGKTIQLNVEGITNTILTDNIPLPQSTALRNIAGGITAPVLDASTLQSLATVTSSTATLGGNISSDGGDPPITSRGTVWNTTGAPITENAVAEGGTATGSFSHLRDTLDTGTLIYFRSYAVNGTGTGYGPDNSFYTEPATSPLSATIDNVGDTGFTINWPANPAGNGDGVLVVVSTNAITALPTDGAEPAFSSVYPTGADIGTNEYVVYRGTGATSVVVTGLTASTPYNVAVFYSAGVGTGETGINYRQTSPATASQTTNTPAVAPTVETPTFASVTATTAVLGGTMTSDGGAPTVCGVEWSIDIGGPYPNQEPGGACAVDVPFTVSVTGLAPGDTIYYRAYATNSAGTGYSSEDNFLTLATLPTVTIDLAVPLTATTATFSGEVTDNGGATVTDRGTVWGTSPNPTGNILSAGSGLGIFTHERTVLPAGTLVYYRAYATNSVGIAYSADRSFTPTGPPEMIDPPPAATSITHNSAVLGGEISSDGGSAVLARGTVWNITGAPTIADNPVAEGGTSVGVPFSHTRTGLPSGTTIFYRSYATNSTGTGYSANDATFTTETEPTVQASLITFPNVAGRSMRISWTRGNGDGSIVVMREDPPNAKVDPVDGDDYAANADYTVAPELPPVDSQNFVVYKGSGNLVLVTGLSLSTTYSVAIYEYAGTGAGTDYLLLTPAEAIQATTDTPVHNEDNRANCTDCHSHGSFFARDTELKVICETCHNPSGSAATKLEFDNHLAPGKNPAVEFVDCGLCHEMHNPGGTNTTSSFNVITSVTQNNKSFLRANVDKYVTTAVTPAYLHTDQPLREDPHPDAPQDAITPDRAVEGGTDVTATPDDTQATGYCQVCHTLTNYHRSSDTAGSNQCHDGLGNDSCGPAETHCGECHQHNNRFIGSGGSVSCVNCHDQIQGGIPRPIITTKFDLNTTHIPGGSAVATQADCEVCHDQSTHQVGSVNVLNLDNGTTSYTQANPGTATTDTSQKPLEPHCLSCHEDGVPASLPTIGGDQTQSSPFTGSGAPPSIGTTWSTAGHNSPTQSCLGSCHGSAHGSTQNSLLYPSTGAIVSPTEFCFVCHDADGPSSHNIQAKFPAGITPDTVDCDPDPNDGTITGTGTPCNFQETSGSGAPINQRHDVLTEDQTYSGASLSCANCHDPHANNATDPVSDVDTGTALDPYLAGNYNGGGDADSSFGVTQPDYIQFCTACHDGTPPPGVSMDANLVDIATSFSASDHHGLVQGGGSGNGFLKPPYDSSDTVTYSSMNCTDCHGAHGSPNIFNLKSQVTIGGTVMEIGGWTGDGIGEVVGDGPLGSENTVYYLPRMDGRNANDASGVQEDHQWGAWCSFCHQMEAHGRDETTTCTAGHMHGGGKL